VNQLDHIVIAAETMEQGLAYVSGLLGVAVPPGGKHPQMGTHNHLLRLGASQFLEILAVDPAAPQPDRERWFRLDEPGFRQQLAKRPRLLTWVVRTPDIASAVSRCGIPLGDVETMTRGDFRWMMSLRKDGSLPQGGLIPTFIQWPHGIHPTSGMAETGYSLEALEVVHDTPDACRHVLRSLEVDALVSVRAPTEKKSAGLRATIRTPAGLVEID
jgi:hypothetical protein